MSSVYSLACFRNADALAFSITLLLTLLFATYSFLNSLWLILESVTSDAAESFIFEMMLGSSVFVDCRIPDFKFIMKMNVWFWLHIVSYYGSTCAAVLISAYPPIPFNITQTSQSVIVITQSSSSIFTAPTLLFNNTVALAGGIYFIYCCCCECAEFGRRPMFALRESNVENAEIISKMKVATTLQMALVCEVFCYAMKNAKKLEKDAKCNLKQIDALRQRLATPCHMYAVALRVTDETSAAIRLDAEAARELPMCFALLSFRACNFMFKKAYTLHYKK